MSDNYNLRQRNNTLLQKRKSTNSEDSKPNKKTRALSAPAMITTSNNVQPKKPLETDKSSDQATNKVSKKEIDQFEVYDSDESYLSSKSSPIFMLKKPFYKVKKFSREEVNSQLLQLGLDVDRVCPCVKASVQNCYINLTQEGEADPLDQIVVKGKCPNCRAEIQGTLRQIVYQTGDGGCYWGGDPNDLVCLKCKDPFVVVDICRGVPTLECGKYFNHCTDCPGFGACIGDYRNSHCMSCGKHYFAGDTYEFNCTECYSDDEDEDEAPDNYGFGFTNKRKFHEINLAPSPLFSYLFRDLQYTMFDLCASSHVVDDPPYISDEDYSDTPSGCSDNMERTS